MPLSEEEDLARAVIQLREDVAKGMAEFDEEVRSLKRDYARGLITAEEAEIGRHGIIEVYGPILQNIIERQAQLKQRIAARDRARKGTEKAAQPEAERLSSLVQQIQKVDPRSPEYQARVAEIKETMDTMMRKRRALTAELGRKAEEAKRRSAEIDEEIAAIRERMNERKRRMAELGY